MGWGPIACHHRHVLFRICLCMSAFCLDEGGCYRTSVLCTHIHEFLHISHLFHFIYFFVKHISDIWFYMVDIIIGRRTWNCQVRTHIHTKIHTHTHQTKKKKVERARYCYFLPWHTWRKVAHKPNQPIYPSHLSEYATYGLFFEKKWFLAPKFEIPGIQFPTVEKSTVENPSS